MDWDSISAHIDRVERECPTMDIRSNPGTKIMFSYPENGRKSDQRIASERLRTNGIYTIKSILVGLSSTTVELEEAEGAFNTVLFKNHEGGDPIGSK